MKNNEEKHGRNRRRKENQETKNEEEKDGESKAKGCGTRITRHIFEGGSHLRVTSGV